MNKRHTVPRCPGFQGGWVLGGGVKMGSGGDPTCSELEAID